MSKLEGSLAGNNQARNGSEAEKEKDKAPGPAPQQDAFEGDAARQQSSAAKYKTPQSKAATLAENKLQESSGAAPGQAPQASQANMKQHLQHLQNALQQQSKNGPSDKPQAP